ncbi:MAG: hypothetical protein JST93_12795 [Acidobacteria bacterium]|nr:hypothetical protein [Acidobacteriota bacterium]
MEVILANVLLLLSALPTLLLVVESTGRNPEGPVGFHLVTAPLALLQAIALGIAIHSGAFDFIPTGRLLLYIFLLPYWIGSTALPFLISDRGFTGLLSKMGMVLIIAGCFAAVNRLPAVLPATIVLGLAALGGIVLAAGLMKQNFQNSIRAGAASREQMSGFEERQSQFQAEQWAKLPQHPELWQLLSFTRAINKDLKQQCLAKIAAMPDLEQQIQAMLDSNSGQHALAYLMDDYPLRFAPLAPVYAEFLERERKRWIPHLRNNPQAGAWSGTLHRHFEVAGRIIEEGGDLSAPLQRWVQLLERTDGMQPLSRRVHEILRAMEKV